MPRAARIPARAVDLELGGRARSLRAHEDGVARPVEPGAADIDHEVGRRTLGRGRVGVHAVRPCDVRAHAAVVDLTDRAGQVAALDDRQRVRLLGCVGHGHRAARGDGRRPRHKALRVRDEGVGLERLAAPDREFRLWVTATATPATPTDIAPTAAVASTRRGVSDCTCDLLCGARTCPRRPAAAAQARITRVNTTVA